MSSVKRVTLGYQFRLPISSVIIMTRHIYVNECIIRSQSESQHSKYVNVRKYISWLDI